MQNKINLISLERDPTMKIQNDPCLYSRILYNMEHIMGQGGKV